MNNENLVSVVVPIYNVQDYLTICLDSLLCQTYRKFEIILVDDGSTDQCPIICDDYAKKHSNIYVIHKKNGGLSDARNIGLKHANGEYILFIDSDDYIDKRMIEILYNTMVSNKSDIAVCEFREVYDNKLISYTDGLPKVSVFSGKELSLNLFIGLYPKIGFVAWNKMYKKKLLICNHIEYPLGKLYEDAFTTFKLLYYSNNISLVNAPLYFYRMRAGSIIKSNYTQKKVEDFLEADKASVLFYQEKNEFELLAVAVNNMFRQEILLYKDLKKNNQDIYVNKVLDTYRENRTYSRFLRVGFMKKLLYLLFPKIPSIIVKFY